MFRRRSRLSLPAAVKAFERLRPAQQRASGRPDVVRQTFRADRFRTKPARINSAVQPVQGGPASGRAGGIPRQGLFLGVNAPGIRAHISWILFETLWPVPRIGLFSHPNTIRKTRLGFPRPASMAPKTPAKCAKTLPWATDISSAASSHAAPYRIPKTLKVENDRRSDEP